MHTHFITRLVDDLSQLPFGHDHQLMVIGLQSIGVLVSIWHVRFSYTQKECFQLD
jgi:hypothetical protein